MAFVWGGAGRKDGNDGSGNGQSQGDGGDDEGAVAAAVSPSPSPAAEQQVAGTIERAPSREGGEVQAGQRFVARKLPSTGLDAWLLALIGARGPEGLAPASEPLEGLRSKPTGRTVAPRGAPVLVGSRSPAGGEFRSPVFFPRRWTTSAPRS
jgi:hypothetical protein